MYEKNKNHRMTVRFSDEQWAFISEASTDFGVSPSDLVRMIVNITMVQSSSVKNQLEEVEGLAKDNYKDHKHNIV